RYFPKATLEEAWERDELDEHQIGAGSKRPQAWPTITKSVFFVGLALECAVSRPCGQAGGRKRPCLQAETRGEIAPFELVSTCLNSREVLKTGNTKVSRVRIPSPPLGANSAGMVAPVGIA